ncbi:ankyrin repeat domain-containing protein 9 [Tachyglossus aculeatus]|uniref:ankyrin repeat domain-containing protein 9 n=1 Tax=Tachyglossus aculeatus TaxID=9261 RepID=UPI0018F29F6D|nr:ankyrin repeat domain-containing protein 9 [Tachyglossus aculeatus]
MPWDVKRQSSGPGSRAQERAQKQCKKSSFAFYQAVRDLLPVWFLEDMRATEAFHWEEGGTASTYSPSEALLYALVHDHRPYAQYLLGKFAQRALAVPSPTFSCCQAPSPHLAMAVRYNRVHILCRILRAVRDLPAGERAGYLDRRGCGRVEGGQTSLHVACELARPECLFLLLGHGASPCPRDAAGHTPLDLVLQRLGRSSGAAPRDQLLLLDLLFLYVPHGFPCPMRPQLLEDRRHWQTLVGEPKFQWLAGLAPPSLFSRAMQVLVRAISPRHFPEALDQLPLPAFLKPLDLKLKS